MPTASLLLLLLLVLFHSRNDSFLAKSSICYATFDESERVHTVGRILEVLAGVAVVKRAVRRDGRVDR